jgi:hypothetical protein
MLYGTGFGLIFAGIAALVARKASGGMVVDGLVKTESARPAVQETWDIGTSLLVGVAGAAILYGAVTVVAAWLAGPSRFATPIRAFLAPHLRDWRVAYAGAAGLLMLVFLWGPTPGTRRLFPSLLLIGLVLLGVEALRRHTAREFPAVPETPPEPAPADAPEGAVSGWKITGRAP